MKEIRVLGVYVADRLTEAGEVQRLLTKYGCNIKTRLGLHEVDDNHCSINGFILLELCGDPEKWDELESALRAVAGIKVEKMSIEDVKS